MARQAKSKTTKNKNRHTCVIVPVTREQHRILKRRARQKETSMSDLVRDYINDLGRRSRKA